MSAEDFEEHLLNHTERVPRFLFRFWHDNSGGRKEHGFVLNDTKAITPLYLMLHPEKTYKQIHELPLKAVWRKARYHLWNESTETFFSSWTQSLPLCLAWAREFADAGNLHISILDVTLLRSPNRVMSAVYLGGLLEQDFSNHSHEFLVYGKITSSAFSSVSWNLLVSSGMLKFMDREGDFSALGLKKPPTCATWAVQIGRLFTPGRVELPVAAHLATIFEDDLGEMDQVIRTLTSVSMQLPAGGLDELTMDVDHYGYLEVLQAAKLLRAAVGLPAEIESGLSVTGLKRMRKQAIDALAGRSVVSTAVLGGYVAMTKGNFLGIGDAPVARGQKNCGVA
ncbi:uncharacterized protein MYCFIDRAFT_83835 [Pseudocercospora fijiensis CIRAD86]|uniref:DUF7587 domain-containing protein n=1 Tax=Pseudocercospora fijiensis (strain CIRAD86) TaxID=383855 RepID=M2YM61_PSEFD|nr:uncharacterized protein MYCFIDRAFT_83835 [Pseudocercospora fijiensis CIRAD86]EME78815.1 hypothetical protein MYCFIDRAFT_83835 [Pseudocercospora fijiensis CIRAD86]